jgi:hypothetical protein
MHYSKKLLICLMLPGISMVFHACSTAADPEGERQPAALVIRSGTSFGMYAGYCYSEVTIAAEATTVARKSFRDKNNHPDKQCTVPAGQDDWQQLQRLINREALQELPETIGCPDCADGGAEWIEIEEGENTCRITFEYNTDIPEIGPLLNKVREIRNRQIQQCQ